MRAICIIASICLSVFTANAQNWPGATDIINNDTTYIIATAGQLDSVRYFLSGTFRIDKDIDLAAYIITKYDTEGWRPIGEKNPLDPENSAFMGYVDGNGHTITNLYIKRPSRDTVGLFGILEGATLKNICVYIDKQGIEGKSYVGGLAGYTNVGSKSTIERCRVIGNVEGKGSSVGGIVGFLFGDMSECRYNGNVSGVNEVGGLAGKLDWSTLKDSYAIANVSGTKGVGGIVGGLSGDENKIESCYVYGNLVSGSDSVGGILGQFPEGSSGDVNNCVAINKKITGTTNTGFIVGSVDTTIGDSRYARNNYRYNATIGTTSGLHIVNGIPVSLDSLQTISIYRDSAHWNFNTTWALNPAVSPYPILKRFSEHEQAFPEFVGTGTDSIPYLIYSAAHLDSMRFHLDKSFRLMNNIEMSYYTNIWYGSAGWLPVGDGTNPFTGKLFGNKFVIRNLRINRDIANVGLFGRTNGAYIDSLGVYVAAGDSVNGNSNVGAIVGYMTNTLLKDSSMIHDCYAVGSIYGENQVGGIVGQIENSQITQCYATGAVKAASSNGGGVAGTVNSSTLIRSYALNNVIGGINIGGVAGTVSTVGIITAVVDSCVAINSSVKGGTGVGRIIGAQSGTVEVGHNYAYNVTAISGDNTGAINGTVTGIANLQSKAFYEDNLGFVFASAPDAGWDMIEGNSFPHLSWETFPEMETSVLGCAGTNNNNSFSIGSNAGKEQIQWLRYAEGSAKAELMEGGANLQHTDWNISGNVLVSVSYYDNVKKVYAHADTIFRMYPAYVGDNATQRTATVTTGAVCPWPEISYGASFNSYSIGVKDTTVIKYTAHGCDSTIKYTLTVNKAAVTITADAKTKEYDDQTFSGFTSTVSPSSSTINRATITYECTGAAAYSPVGTYTITPKCSDTLNYAVTYVSRLLTITRRVVAVKAEDVSKIAGAALPPLEYEITSGSLLSGDSFTGALACNNLDVPGASYPITQGTLAIVDSRGDNYTLNFTPGTLHIYVAQEITWTQTMPDFCTAANRTVTLNANSTTVGATPPGEPITYTSSDINVAQITGNTMTMVGPGKATITANQAGNTYYRVAEPKTMEVSMDMPAENYLMLKWDDVLVFNNQNDKYKTYQWYKNNQAVAGAISQTFYDKNKIYGNYYVVATTASGESGKTCPWIATSAPAPVAAELLKIYPNPISTGQIINVEIAATRKTLQEAYINIVDINGNIILVIKNVEPTMQITVPTKQGYYIMVLYRKGKDSVTETLLVQ